MTDIADLRLHRIRAASAALRRAGYRTTPPPDTEADQWISSIQAGEDEDGHPVHRVIWHPCKEAMDWQHARFGPFEPSPADLAERDLAGGRDEREERNVTGDNNGASISTDGA